MATTSKAVFRQPFETDTRLTRPSLGVLPPLHIVATGGMLAFAFLIVAKFLRGSVPLPPRTDARHKPKNAELSLRRPAKPLFIHGLMPLVRVVIPAFRDSIRLAS